MLSAARDVLRKINVDVGYFSVGKSLEGRRKTLLEAFEVTCAIDAGANEGQFGTSLRKFGYRGLIVSFEPAQKPFSILERAAAADGKWQVEKIALGASEGTATLHVMDCSTLNSLYSPNAYGSSCFPQINVEHEEVVQVARLDTVVHDIPELTAAQSIFLKVDTQGHDLEVIRGSEGFLPKVNLIQMELSVNALYANTPSWTNAIHEIEARGFGLAGLFPVNFDKSHQVIEFDGLFVRSPRAQA